MITLSIRCIAGDQLTLVVNVRKSVDQMGTLVRINIWNHELPILFSIFSQAVIVTHQPVGRDWDMEGNYVIKHQLYFLSNTLLTLEHYNIYLLVNLLIMLNACHKRTQAGDDQTEPYKVGGMVSVRIKTNKTFVFVIRVFLRRCLLT